MFLYLLALLVHSHHLRLLRILLLHRLNPSFTVKLSVKKIALCKLCASLEENTVDKGASYPIKWLNALLNK